MFSRFGMVDPAKEAFRTTLNIPEKEVRLKRRFGPKHLKYRIYSFFDIQIIDMCSVFWNAGNVDTTDFNFLEMAHTTLS